MSETANLCTRCGCSIGSGVGVCGKCAAMPRDTPQRRSGAAAALKAYRERMGPEWARAKDRAAKDAATAQETRATALRGAPCREPGEDDGPVEDPAEALRARAKAATEDFMRGAEDGTE